MKQKCTSVKYISSYITIHGHVSVASATIFFVSHKITQCTNNLPIHLRTVRPIYRTGVPLPSRCCILYIFFLTTICTEYFKHAAHSPFFSSKCRLFHNVNFFGSCIIHILHTECPKI
jgi:hypothetical protein